jgi:anti-sigma factor RsiW
MNSPWSPEDLDVLLSCYLDGELDLALRLDLEGWLGTHPEGQGRLGPLRAAATALAGLRAQTPVPSGWTLRAYQIGLPIGQPALQRMMVLGLGQAMARPRVLGHGPGPRRVRRRWRLRVR